MADVSLMTALLDSMKDPVLVADVNHVVRYMNKPAIGHYEAGAALLGTSLLDCHNETSNQQIKEILAAMLAGEVDERLITDDEKHRIYMRAVRNEDGQLLGYYERYEPPVR